jgi:hypothetical protein
MYTVYPVTASPLVTTGADQDSEIVWWALKTAISDPGAGGLVEADNAVERSPSPAELIVATTYAYSTPPLRPDKVVDGVGTVRPSYTTESSTTLSVEPLSIVCRAESGIPAASATSLSS